MFLLCNLGIWDKLVSKVDLISFLESLWGFEGEQVKERWEGGCRVVDVVIISTVDEESGFGEVVFNLSFEGDDSMKFSFMIMIFQFVEKQDKMV